jgi:peptidoglycan/LPS O-acetylase OafA/YrhL
VNGFLVVSHARLYDSVRRLRWLSLALAVAVTGGLLVVYLQRGEPVYRTPYYGVLFGLYGVASWCWILAMLGQAAQHLRFPKPWLAYANEAVLPFYVLHQTVLLTVGYVVVRWQIPDLLKWAVIVTGSLSVCLVLYEFLIRRNTMLRFLFGMKPMPKTSVTAPTRPWPLARDRRPGI